MTSTATPLLLPRPAPRRRAGGGRGGAQSGLRRRRAGRRSPTASTSATPSGREISWQLSEAIRGMAEACARSACRWSAATSPSTTRPTGRRSTRRRRSAWSGVLDRPSHAVRAGFRGRRRRIVLLGDDRSALGGAELPAPVHGRVDGPHRRPSTSTPSARLARLLARRSPAAGCCARRTTSPTAASRSPSPSAASAAAAASRVPDLAGRGEVTLFCEGQARAIVSCAPADARRVLARAGGGVPRSERRRQRRAIADRVRRARASTSQRPLAEACSRSPAIPARCDGPLMCGVFGIYAPDRDVARLTYFGLYALQHRGQESAGIAPPTAAAHSQTRHGPRSRRSSTRRDLRRLGRPPAPSATPATRPPARARWPQRPADRRRHLPGPHRGARPQRQPGQRRRAARASWSRRGSILQTTTDTEVIAAPDRPAPRRDWLEDASRDALAARRRLLAWSC